MYREIKTFGVASHAVPVVGATGPREKTFFQAMVQLIIADVSMSLDNVLAVAGAADDHLVALIIGLLLSIALMGTAASLIAKYLGRWRWLTVVGLLIIVLVALDMIWRGSQQVVCSGLLPSLCFDHGAAIGT
jgi:predicted tellurium resistance membrane protein TerC